MSQLQAIDAGAHAREITDKAERDRAWRLLMDRHANLGGFEMPDSSQAAFMRATCKHISVLDFTQGPGHHKQLTIDERGAVIEGPRHDDDWALSASAQPSRD